MENKSSLYCAHCAKSGISCTSSAQPSNCSQFINVSSDDVREYVRWKVVAIMESLNIPEDKINEVKTLPIQCF